jgi:hypothetical protein
MSAKNHQKKAKTPFLLVRSERLVDVTDTIQFTVYLDEERTDKMKMYIPVFEGGSIEDWLEWRKSFGRLILQKEITEAPKLFCLLRILLTGNALNELDTMTRELAVAADEENAAIAEEVEEEAEAPALMAVEISDNFAQVICWMLVEDFKTRIKEINEYLDVMPEYRGENKSLTKDELQIIFENAMPKSWKDSMSKTGRSEEMEFNDVVTYMKMMEDLESETEDPSRKPLSYNNDSRSNRSSNRSSRGNGRGGGSGGGGSSGGGSGGGGSGGQYPRGPRPGGNHGSGVKGNGGSGGNGNTGYRRTSSRIRKPYCATCKTNQHGWNECEHNPKNQGRDASAIDSK